MIGRCLNDSLVVQSSGGHCTAIRGPPSENLCYVDQTSTAGTLHGHLRVTARSSADSRPQIADCNVIARSSSDARAIIHRSSATLSPCKVLLCVLRLFINRFLDIRRRPAGPPAVTAGRPADRRRFIGRNFGHPQSESGGHQAVTWRWPADVWCLTFTTRFKVEKIRR